MKQWIVTGVVCLMTCFLMFFWGWFFAHKHIEPTPNTTDTVVVTNWDTVFVDVLHPITQTLTRYDTVTLCDTLCDTVVALVPISTYEYDTVVDSCNVQMCVDGYGVQVYDLSVAYPYKTVTVTQYLPQKRSWFREHVRAGIFAGGGYGIVHRQFDVYVGIGGGVVW